MYAHRGNALAEILSTHKRAERKQHAATQRANTHARDRRSARGGASAGRKRSPSHR